MYIDRTAYCAVEAMAKIALHGRKRPCTPTEIAAWVAEPPGFVASVMARLNAAGLVTYAKGPIVGYALALAARNTSIADIFAAVDDTDSIESVAAPTDDDMSSLAVTHFLWQALRSHLSQFLCEISLADVLEDDAESTRGGATNLLSVVQRSRALH